MVAADLLKLEWKKLDDWSTLVATDTGYINITDVRIFFDSISRNISQVVGVPYDEVRRVMVEQNTTFIYYVNHMFMRRVFKTDSEEVQRLKDLLIVPVTNYSAQHVVQMYNMLSKKDKKQFIDIINNNKSS